MSDTTNSAVRRLHLLTLLQSRKNITVNELVQEFGVSRRTIFRDINALADMNIPIVSDRNYGYSLPKGYTIPPLTFNERELSTLIVGLGFLKGQIDDGLANDARNVEAKIQSVLPDHLKSFMTTVASKMVLYPYQKDMLSVEASHNWFSILTAINESKSITCTYESLREESTSVRQIDPYILVYYGDHWDLIGYCHSHNSLRTFVLKRISDIVIQHNTFVSRRGLGLEALLFRETENDALFEVTVSSSIADSFIRNLPAKIERHQIAHESHIIAFHFDNVRWMNTWLLQFGPGVTVLGPESALHDRKVLLQELLHQT